MKPSGSSPSYAAPGSRVCQFGVSSVNESHRWRRHELGDLAALEDDVVDPTVRQLLAHREPAVPAADDHHIRPSPSYHGPILPPVTQRV